MPRIVLPPETEQLLDAMLMRRLLQRRRREQFLRSTRFVETAQRLNAMLWQRRSARQLHLTYNRLNHLPGNRYIRPHLLMEFSTLLDSAMEMAENSRLTENDMVGLADRQRDEFREFETIERLSREVSQPRQRSQAELQSLSQEVNAVTQSVLDRIRMNYASPFMGFDEAILRREHPLHLHQLAALRDLTEMVDWLLIPPAQQMPQPAQPVQPVPVQPMRPIQPIQPIQQMIRELQIRIGAEGIAGHLMPLDIEDDNPNQQQLADHRQAARRSWQIYLCLFVCLAVIASAIGYAISVSEDS